MAKKAEGVQEFKSLRVELSSKLHKRVRQAALDEDTTVKQLVICVLDAYTALPRRDRNLVLRGCRDGVMPAGEEIDR